MFFPCSAVIVGYLNIDFSRPRTVRDDFPAVPAAERSGIGTCIGDIVEIVGVRVTVMDVYGYRDILQVRDFYSA